MPPRPALGIKKAMAEREPFPPATLPAEPLPHEVQAMMHQITQWASAAFPLAAADTILVDSVAGDFRFLVIRISKAVSSPQSTLSPREREIARLVACGHANKTIAGVLSISSWTVNTYLRRIFVKLGVGSRAAMVAKLLGADGASQHLRHETNVPGEFADDVPILSRRHG